MAETEAGFIVVHRLKRRLRFVVPSLRGRAAALERLALQLGSRPGVLNVRLAVPIGSIAVHFDPGRLSPQALIQCLERALTAGRGAHANLPPPEASPVEHHLMIGGMQCRACARLLEEVLANHPAVVHITVDHLSTVATIVTSLPQEALLSLGDDLGYRFQILDTADHHRLLQERPRLQLQVQARRLRQAAGYGLPVLLLGLLPPTPLRRGLQALLAGLLLWRQGTPLARRAWSQVRHGSAGSASLMTLGAGASYLYSLPAVPGGGGAVYFDATVTILGLAQLGQYLEVRSRHRMIQALLQLLDLRPGYATVLEGGEERRVEVGRIRRGERLLVRPGERIPVDGVVEEGLSSVDEGAVSGRAIPVIKEPGNPVLGGSLNGTGALTIRAREDGEDSRPERLLQLTRGAEARGMAWVDAADRLSARFVPLVSALAGVTFGAWWLAGAGVGRAVGKALAVLLIACPCPLGVAVPSATVSALSRGARRGIHIRDPKVFETVAGLDRVVLDKTGVVTVGRPTIVELLNLSPLEDPHLLGLAAGAEHLSAEPLARAFVEEAREQGIERPQATRFHVVPGSGIQAQVKGHEVLLGNRTWLWQRGVDTTPLEASARKVSGQGRIAVLMAVDGRPAGLFTLEDALREEVGRTIDDLRRQGVAVVLMSGDSEETNRRVAARLGIGTVIAPADPARKLALIRAWQETGERVAMVGDGINDAPALAAADLGMALAAGSDMAIEAAQVVLEDPLQVPETLRLGRQAVRDIRTSLFWTFVFNSAAVPVAMAGRLSPALATLAMSLSSLAVVLNTFRFQSR